MLFSQLCLLSGDGERALLKLLYNAIREKNITTVMITHDPLRMEELISFKFDQIVTMPRQTRAAEPNRYGFYAAVSSEPIARDDAATRIGLTSQSSSR